MPRRISKSLFLLLWMMGPLLLLAQPKLKVEFIESSPTDTVRYYLGDSVVHYRAYVTNVGNNQLNGPCDIVFKYNQSTDTFVVASWIAQTFEVGQTDTVVFHDTIFNLNANRYKGGDNIIVIWPHSDNPAQAPDTTTFGIYVKDSLAIASADPAAVESRIDLYPNPANDRIQIRYLENRHKVECVRIIGIDGRVHYQSGKAVGEIDIASLAPGLYFVDFRFKDGIHGAMRLLKE